MVISIAVPLTRSACLLASFLTIAVFYLGTGPYSDSSYSDSSYSAAKVFMQVMFVTVTVGTFGLTLYTLRVRIFWPNAHIAYFSRISPLCAHISRIFSLIVGAYLGIFRIFFAHISCLYTAHIWEIVIGVNPTGDAGRLANRPGMAGIVPELTHGVPCPGRGSFCPGNVKIEHRAWIYGCSLMSVLYFVLCLSVTHDLT